MKTTLFELVQKVKKAQMKNQKRLKPQTVDVKKLVSVDDDRVLSGMMMLNGYDRMKKRQVPTLDMYDRFPTKK